MRGSEEESTSRATNSGKPRPAATKERQEQEREEEEEEEEEEDEDQCHVSCTDELECRGREDADEEEEDDDDDDGAETSLRLWLDRPERSVDLFECLHIFRQVVEMVSLAHSQGIAVDNVRPSCFIMSAVNRVSFIESASCSSSGSDSCGNELQGFEDKDDDLCSKSRDQASETSCLRSCEQRGREGVAGTPARKNFPLKRILLMEYNWYTSPEEISGVSGSFASDIYKLGVLLFELFCPTRSLDEKQRTMSNLRHRVLPPSLLLKFPKEASFCLWLLHPQPSTRPKLSEVLQSEFLNEPKDSLEEREGAIKLREEIEKQELLLEFLLRLQKNKQEAADSVRETVFCLTSDIEEILKQLETVKNKDGSFVSDLDHEEQQARRTNKMPDDSAGSGSRKRIRPRQRSKNPNLEPNQTTQEAISSKSYRLMKNFKKLEGAYLSTRCSNIGGARKGSEWINPFLEGLRKYLAFSKFRVRADLRQGDLLSSSNLVCSVGFDRDKELFATAGVNRKIKIFECDAVLNDDRDVHYPLVEMVSRSRLSCLCWNGYIKSQIASSDFDGVVQVWDVTRSKVFVEMREHEQRVWSVDFSAADPTKLASGGDDCAVKLWNINQAIPLSHLVAVARGRSRPTPTYAQCNSRRTLRAPWPSDAQIIASISTIFVA
ncbi:protein SPA1-RELATED 3-like isoform X2 [Wolffia australiana]